MCAPTLLTLDITCEQRDDGNVIGTRGGWTYTSKRNNDGKLLIHRVSQYRQLAHFNVTHQRRKAFYALPSAEWALLSAPPFNILATLDSVDDAMDFNANIAVQILDIALIAFGLEREPCGDAADWRGTATQADLEQATSVIQQLYRD